MRGARAASAPQEPARESWSWLPEALRPRSVELPGSGRMRLIETTLLVLIGVLLATATINDVVRQTHVNERLIADVATWRSYTGHAYHNLNVDQELFGSTSGREAVCGNTVPGAPKTRTQICLAIWGPVHAGRRVVEGGWYLPPGSEDERADRYGCFGAGAEGICPR
ncbi:MAG TPA: hypothetical protein VKG82_06160 [Solirubrobacteraceae bacterium]|nr:hypothetical protein [Solirubrobacteraceae bacterium]